MQKRKFIAPKRYTAGFLELEICSTSAILESYICFRFLHFEEIVRVKIAVHFEIIVIEAYTTF